MTRRRNAKLTIVALALIAALASVPAVAGPGGHGPGRHGPHAGPRGPLGPIGAVLRDLDLSREQRERIHEILDGAREGELGEAMRAIRTARHDVEVLLWRPGTTEADLLAAADEAAVVAKRALVARKAVAASVLEVLDDEQRAAVIEAMQNPPEDRPLRRGGWCGKR